MPVHTLSGNRNFRYDVGSTDGDTFAGSAAQRDPADDSVFCGNLLLIKELTELLSFGIGRNGRCQTHSKALRTSTLNTFAGSRPCSVPTMEVMQPWCRAIQADLQDDSIAWQSSQAFRASPGK